MSSPVVVGRLADGDLPTLAGLYKQFWGEDSSPEKMREVFGRLSEDPDYLFLGARHGRTLVGSALRVVCEDLYGDCRPFLLIEDFVVDESRRRLGVGSALIRELERHAAERDCAYILLLTDAYRDDAVRFYESLGYECDRYRGFKKRLPRA